MNNKETTSTILVILLIFGMVTMVMVNADPPLPTLFVTPTVSNASLLGGVFTIDINVTAIQNLWGFEFKLGYNTTLLDVIDAVNGSFLPLASFGALINETDGYVFVYGDCGMESVNGSGSIATITFNATYAETTSCTLDLYDTILFDIYGDDITHLVEDGIYTFGVLDVTVATISPTYSFGEIVEIYGSLKLGNLLVQGLVAIHVNNPNNGTVVVRTLQTGPDPPPSNITLVDVYTCNSDGVPKKNFTRGATWIFNYLWVGVTVANHATTRKYVTIYLNAYDRDMVPFGVKRSTISIASESSVFVLKGIPIPDWASLGNGTVYANVFTDTPKDGGVPYCPEKLDTFLIVDSQGGTTPGGGGTAANITVGNYSLTFRLPIHGVTPGNHTIFATSSYLRQQTMSTITFDTNLIGDVDGDGDVDGGDQRKIQLAMFTMPGDPRWNPNADVDGDGDVDGGDQRICQIHMFEG